MSTFAVHTVVHRDGFPVFFTPGDELPEWAEGVVGDHVLTADSKPAPKDDETDDEADEDSTPASDVPDFTAPAPARRGRPRKQ